MKLTTRILALVGASILPGVLAAGYTEFSLRAERAQEVRQLAMRNSRQAAALVEQVLVSTRSVLTAAAAAGQTLNSDQCGAYLQEIRGRLEFLGGLGLIDPAGILRCASGTSSPVDLSDRNYFISAQQSKTFVVGEYVKGRLSQRGLLMTAMALPGVEEKPPVLFASLDLGSLQKEVEAMDVPAGASVTIADRTGTIIARSPQPDRFIGTRIPPPYDQLVNATTPHTLDLMSQDGTRRILAYIPVAYQPVGLYVSTGLSFDEAFRLIDRSRSFTLAVTAACFTLALAVALLLGRAFITKPVESILATMERWRSGAPYARTFATSARGEIGTIGSSLDQLLDELDHRLRQRDLLSRELAHRVKNTLAIVQAIASQSMRGGPGLKEFNARLAALARAYDVLLASQWESSTLRRVIAAAIEPHQSAMKPIETTGPDAEIDARAVLALTLVLHELCTNALKYGALSVPSGKVDLRFRIEEDGRVRLTWQESGGPAVRQGPRATGFGTTLIRNAFSAGFEPHVELAYNPEGVRCEISFRATAPAAAA